MLFVLQWKVSCCFLQIEFKRIVHRSLSYVEMFVGHKIIVVATYNRAHLRICGTLIIWTFCCKLCQHFLCQFSTACAGSVLSRLCISLFCCCENACVLVTPHLITERPFVVCIVLMYISDILCIYSTSHFGKHASLAVSLPAQWKRHKHT